METKIHKSFLVVSVGALIFSLSGWMSAPWALAAGAALSALLPSTASPLAKTYSKFALSLSIILLGAGVDLNLLFQVGYRTFHFTALGIALTLALGALLGKAFGVEKNMSQLVSFGTAICGGSAIATLAPIIGADATALSMSLAIVYLFNAVGLFLFPVIGHTLHLTETDFGTWAALAIHDTSSVVGAGLTYGPKALEVATPIKLSRALWIIPVASLFSWLESRKNNREPNSASRFPIFIFGYLLVASFFSFYPKSMMDLTFIQDSLYSLGKRGLVFSIFLTGLSIQFSSIRKLGFRPLLHAAVLWMGISVTTLFLILKGTIQYE
jgi:uncharacterized integral membrane protein (TIGR00698 family)